MFSQNGTNPDRVVAALTAAGEVAYELNLASDSLVWHGSVGDVLGIADRGAIGSGRALAGLVNPADLTARQRALNGLTTNGMPLDIEYRLRAEDGRFNWVHDRGRVELGADGATRYLVGLIRPINERKAHEIHLEQRANLDDLTGHSNKAHLQEAVQQVLGVGGTTPRSSVFLAVGIDNMAVINDAFGFEAADAVIVAVGERLEQSLGAADLFGRIGGDRFGILLVEAGEEHTDATAERILSAISGHPIVTSAGPIYVTVSIGCAAYPRQASTPEDVMTRAETALAEAKRAGRDCFARYRLTEGERAQHRSNMAMGERVQRALREDRLMFAYQPVIGSRDGKVDYYECLLRMRHEDGGIVTAGRFVPMIEQLGLIRNIDRFVLERAIEEIRASTDICLGFNISGLTASHQPWLDVVVGLLAGAPAIASRVVVEITETAALRDLDESARFVRTLRDLGCRIAIDDFGAGFTSLRHLQKLAVEIVKIDGSFVRNLVTQRDSQLFVRHLLGLAKGLGLKTVAEWVETAEDAALLAELGVELLQGYYFGEPSIVASWPAVPPRRAQAQLSPAARSTAAC
jgi:diguanylate cyclase (GGDEF)-like protein